MVKTWLGRLSAVEVTSQAGLTIRQALFAGRQERRLGRSVGTTQFGVNHVTLAPGALSALRHWHEEEDEFVYVLAGELTLIDDNGEHRIEAGCFAGFPAGAANAHHLANKSDAPAQFLSIGSRKVGDETIHYPDDPELGIARVTRDACGERSR